MLCTLPIRHSHTISVILHNCLIGAGHTRTCSNGVAQYRRRNDSRFRPLYSFQNRPSVLRERTSVVDIEPTSMDVQKGTMFAICQSTSAEIHGATAVRRRTSQPRARRATVTPGLNEGVASASQWTHGTLESGRGIRSRAAAHWHWDIRQPLVTSC